MVRARKSELPRILSAGLIPVHRGGGEARYLLLRAYSYWDFPKGMVEPGEDPLAAARRELCEETTLTGASFLWGEDYRETEPYARNKVARYYFAEVPTTEVSLPVSPALGRPEHDEYRWASYEEARSLVSDRVKPILDWAHALITAEREAREPSEAR